jgi:hypothetical protein
MSEPAPEAGNIEVPRELFSRIYNTLAFYANKCSYEPPRIGGVLKGCPRGPAPTAAKLAFSARLMMRTIDVDLLKRDGAAWPMDDVESPREPDGNDAEDAANWRALVGCARIKLMGAAGLHPESPQYATPFAHIGLEFWTHHQAAGDIQDINGRDWLAKFMVKALRRQAVRGSSTTKSGGT